MAKKSEILKEAYRKNYDEIEWERWADEMAQTSFWFVKKPTEKEVKKFGEPEVMQMTPEMEEALRDKETPNLGLMPVKAEGEEVWSDSTVDLMSEYDRDAVNKAMGSYNKLKQRVEEYAEAAKKEQEKQAANVLNNSFNNSDLFMVSTAAYIGTTGNWQMQPGQVIVSPGQLEETRQILSSGQYDGWTGDVIEDTYQDDLYQTKEEKKPVEGRPPPEKDEHDYLLGEPIM